jgi:hypothetical protein
VFATPQIGWTYEGPPLDLTAFLYERLRDIEFAVRCNKRKKLIKWLN